MFRETTSYLSLPYLYKFYYVRGPMPSAYREIIVQEVHEWCHDQFGPMDERFAPLRWWRTHYVLNFMYESDAFAFKMRWC